MKENYTVDSRREKMKISPNYRRVLDTYLEWKDVRTPASGSFQEGSKPTPKISVSEDGLFAEEAICVWESQGKSSCIRPGEEDRLSLYLKGKSQRDWWTREIGWWNKNAAYVPEEFLAFLGPLPFIELFGRAPITRIVRYYFDNNYRLWEFSLDQLMLRCGIRWKMEYYERDDRDSALVNAWRMFWVKWCDPFAYRLKRRVFSLWESNG